MMSRAFATNGSSNGFAGMHAPTGTVAPGNGTIMGSGVMSQVLNGSVGAHAAAVVPGQNIGTMVNGLTGATGVDVGTIMSGIGLGQMMIGAAGTSAATVVPGQGLGTMMSNIIGDSGLGIGSMMGNLIQDGQIGTTDTSTTTHNFAQTMLDFMGSQGGIQTVGVSHMNLVDFFVA